LVLDVEYFLEEVMLSNEFDIGILFVYFEKKTLSRQPIESPLRETKR